MERLSSEKPHAWRTGIRDPLAHREGTCRNQAVCAVNEQHKRFTPVQIPAFTPGQKTSSNGRAAQRLKGHGVRRLCYMSPGGSPDRGGISAHYTTLRWRWQKRPNRALSLEFLFSRATSPERGWDFAWRREVVKTSSGRCSPWFVTGREEELNGNRNQQNDLSTIGTRQGRDRDGDRASDYRKFREEHGMAADRLRLAKIVWCSLVAACAKPRRLPSRGRRPRYPIGCCSRLLLVRPAPRQAL